MTQRRTRIRERLACVMAPKKRYYACMATVQIRNLDDDAYAILRRRAADSGRSLQEYLRVELERVALRPTVAEALARARAELTTEVSMDDIVALQRQERGE